MKSLFQTAAVAVTALLFMACNSNNTNANATDTTATDAIDTSAVVAEAEQPAELVLTNQGIGDILQLGMAIDKLPTQVEGLYDKFEVHQENDEGETITVFDFTLGDKYVMTGVSDDDKTIGTLSIASDKVILRSGDKAWHIGDKPDGLKFNDEYQYYEHEGIIINIDTQGLIDSFLIGY